MVYALSYKGANELRRLAENVIILTDMASDEAKKLRASVEKNSNELGEFYAKIDDMLIALESASSMIDQSAEHICNSLVKKAESIEEILMADGVMCDADGTTSEGTGSAGSVARRNMNSHYYGNNNDRML